MPTLIVEDLPYSTFARFTELFVRGFAYAAPSDARIGASCKLGAVQVDRGL